MADIRIHMPNGDDFRPKGDIVISHVMVPKAGSNKPAPCRTVDLELEHGLHNMVYLSLFTDRRAEPGDVPPGEDRRGSVIDDLLDPNDRFGSRLWLLGRKKLPEVLRFAEFYAEEALNWMIPELCDRIPCEASWHPTEESRIRLYTPLLRGSATLYEHLWSVSLES